MLLGLRLGGSSASGIGRRIEDGGTGIGASRGSGQGLVISRTGLFSKLETDKPFGCVCGGGSGVFVSERASIGGRGGNIGVTGRTAGVAVSLGTTGFVVGLTLFSIIGETEGPPISAFSAILRKPNVSAFFEK